MAGPPRQVVANVEGERVAVPDIRMRSASLWNQLVACLASPAGQVVSDLQGVDVVGAEDRDPVGQHGGELVAGVCVVAHLTGPQGGVVAGTEGRGMVGTELLLHSDQQVAEVVARGAALAGVTRTGQGTRAVCRIAS